jgi:PPK2 family polyphosphate:nucleotide phosphotransferase
MGKSTTGQFRIEPGQRTDLGRRDPGDLSAFPDRTAAEQQSVEDAAAIDKLQDRLYAEQKRALLVVLQGTDTAGKDGTIRYVFKEVGPIGVAVTAFRRPSETELAHDFLWRAHAAAPRRGYIGIFNRSHYEDVLVTRVHKLIDKATWTRRYQEICDFEALLVRSGTTILKFFLHISKEEQLARFAQRLEDPGRNWKISEGDYTEREFWDDYIEAFEDAIRATSTHEAPWYVIPSNAKWFRNLAVSQIIADAMADLDLAYPPPSVNLAEIRRKYHAAAHEAVGGGKKA